MWGLGSSQDPDMGLLLLILAGGKGRHPTIEPASKTKYHTPPLPHTPPAGYPGSQHPLPSCSPQGHHPSSSEVSSRLPGHSHQLFSHPSKDPGVQACPPPFPGIQGPHSTCPGMTSLLQEVGTIFLAGGPGCGLRSHETPLYSPAQGLALKLQGPAGERGLGPL